MGKTHGRSKAHPRSEITPLTQINTPLTPVENPKSDSPTKDMARKSTVPMSNVPHVSFDVASKTKSLPLPIRPATNVRSRRINILNLRTSTTRTKTDRPWIHRNIPYKICKTFIKTKQKPDKDGKLIDICGCGGDLAWHDGKPNTKPAEGTVWNSTNHIRQHNGYCFGKIRFVEEDGQHQPEFVRIADDFLEKKRSVHKIFDLLEKKWRLPQPNLIISVTGGAADFKCPPELEKRFKKGLVKAAKTTEAWIFTGGTNTGVMKLVGEAVRGTSFDSQIVTIGIATWGIVMNRTELRSDKSQSSVVRNYHTKSIEVKQRGAFLDPSHTHFMLCDNGTQFQYGVEIPFRAKLEQLISERYGTGGSTLPQICILVEGGKNSIATLLETVRLGNPGLVIAGSGRAADVMAEAYRMSTREEAIDRKGEKVFIRALSETATEELTMVISQKFPTLKPAEKDEVLQQIIELLELEKYLTIYELNDSKDLDLALLAALIRGNKDGTSSLASMKLAVTWDRPGLAESMILPKSTFSNEEKAELLKMAILQDKPKFIKMMLDQGVDMKHFLTHRVLADLFNEIDKTFVCYKKLKNLSCEGDKKKKDQKLELRLKHIGMFIEEILEGTYQSEFTTSTFQRREAELLESPFEYPYDMMVIYAVFAESQTMAKLFWGSCKHPIATALIAYKILEYLADIQRCRLSRDEENEKKLLQWAQEFENLAVGVMKQCFKDRNHQKELWLEVLQIKQKGFGHLNLVELATTTNATHFVAQGAVQTLLTDMWLGQIHAAQDWVKISIAAAIPILGPLFIMRYTKLTEADRAEDESKVSRESVPDLELNDLGETVEMDGELEHSGEEPSQTKRKLDPLERLYHFYNAPIVKFTYYSISYLVFLCIYIYVLVFARPRFKSKYEKDTKGYNDWVVGRYSGYELYLLLYVLSTIPTEIKQIAAAVPATLRMKIFVYLKDFFNILDVLGLFCFLAGFVLKSQGDADFAIPLKGNMQIQNYYHLLFILSFLFYCVRLIQLFQIHSKMGPKIIMIGQMWLDLMFFFVLMIVFLLAYGVSAQALMKPNQGLETDSNLDTNFIIFDLIYRPYLHVFGEIDFDGMYSEIVEGHCEGNDTLAPDDENYCDLTQVRSQEIGRAHFYLVQGLLAIYLIFINILLINLLIAIFSKTYEDIQQTSDTVWKVQRSTIILEYSAVSFIPQPFSIAYHLVECCAWVVRKCRKCCNEAGPKLDVDENAVYRVSMIEAESRERFVNQQEDDDDATAAQVYRDLKDELDVIKSLVRNTSSMTAPPPAHPPTDTPQYTTATGSKSDRKYSKSYSAGDISTRLTRIKPLKVHMDSRKSPYPGSDVKRFKIPDDKVSWLVRYPEYEPVSFTSPEVMNQTGDSCDPHDIHLHPSIQFNKICRSTVKNKSWIIDRTSHHGKYNVVGGLPQNPKGRTGIVGRGSLLRWGPNHAADTVVTRWHRDPRGQVVRVDDLPVIEFVAIFRTADNQWAIPGGRVRPNERVLETIKREFSEEALTGLARGPAEQAAISTMVSEHFRLGITLYKGYTDDPRNTDNSWMETVAVNYHDPSGSSFGCFPLGRDGPGAGPGDGPEPGVRWVAVDHNLDLYANHEWIVEKVCYHRDAYNPIKEPKRRDTEVWVTGHT